MESLPKRKVFDYENNLPKKVTIVDLPEFHEKSIREVMEHVKEKYSSRYHLPGIEYMEYLLENPTKIPKEINENGKEYFFPSAPIQTLQSGLEDGACLQLDQFGHLLKSGALRSGWSGRGSHVVLLSLKKEEKGKKK